MTVAGGTAYRHYVPAGTTTVLYTRWNTGANTTHYRTNDQVGSTSVVTDASGALTVKESFTAYGARRSATGWSGAPAPVERVTSQQGEVLSALGGADEPGLKTPLVDPTDLLGGVAPSF